MDKGVMYFQFILLLTFAALGFSQSPGGVQTQKSDLPPKPEPPKLEAPKTALVKPDASKPEPIKPVVSAADKQKSSIQRQLESVKKINPDAFPITKLPGEEPPPPPPPSSAPAVDPAKQIACYSRPSMGLEPVITLAAARAGISSDLVRAVITQESAFNPCAVSRKGAIGLMQLMPETARQFGVSNPFDPTQNISAGATLLRQLLDRYGGDLALALSAYNAGATTVDRAGRVPDIAETTNYVRRIMGSLGMQ